MVTMEQFPLFRLATLVARQMSAPLASRFKEYAKGHPVFSRKVCMRIARRYYEFDIRYKMWSLRLKQPRQTPPISDQQALNTGADMLGEMVIFGLGAAIIVFEVNRQATNQEAKELAVISQWQAVVFQLEELRHELALQQADIDRLHTELRRHLEA